MLAFLSAFLLRTAKPLGTLGIRRATVQRWCLAYRWNERIWLETQKPLADTLPVLRRPLSCSRSLCQSCSCRRDTHSKMCAGCCSGQLGLWVCRMFSRSHCKGIVIFLHFRDYGPRATAISVLLIHAKTACIVTLNKPYRSQVQHSYMNNKTTVKRVFSDNAEGGLKIEFALMTANYEIVANTHVSLQVLKRFIQNFLLNGLGWFVFLWSL